MEKYCGLNIGFWHVGDCRENPSENLSGNLSENPQTELQTDGFPVPLSLARAAGFPRVR